MKKVEYDADDDQMLLRQKYIYNELTEQKKNEIEKLDKMVKRNELLYKYKNNSGDVDFSNFHGAIDTINKIASGDIRLSKAVDNQYELRSKLGEVKKGNPKCKSKKNLRIIKNTDNLYNARQAATDFIIEYTERVSEAKSRAKQERKGLKILIPKQMLKKLTMALA